ncbi:hypothetical protein [Bergeyella zoohelcum]|uniref:Uncharacterized protein n=1 Tax=Bergeyella zoohelcum TaxID=1015 RepID=A0A376C007_9FLAO|nr:hypothetical protein [Bergeyella zoohelcum]EKB60754.1 hypothetical protein HMPREF9700_00249 [Bergeyella zoohelcum CCUG 30536]SSZ47155.1 Uncharacterised protein [Bergeyella zoohelcum]
MSKEKTKIEEVAPEVLLNQRKAELDEREATIVDKETVLNERETEINEREIAVAEKESKLKDLEKKLKTKEPTAKSSAVKKEPVSFEFNGEFYVFADHAPQLIRIDGQVLTQEEIVQDEELLLQLVAGNSSLIEKK